MGNDDSSMYETPDSSTERYQEEYGTWESDSEINERIKEYFRRNSDRNSVDSAVLEKATRVALAPFSPLGPGESVSVVEYRRRLRDIKSTGYDVPTYSHLNRKRLEVLYSNLRSRITRESREAN